LFGRALEIVLTVTSTGGVALPGAQVTVNGESVGSTDDAGELILELPRGEDLVTIAVSKPFFKDGGAEDLAYDRTTEGLLVELAPYIYVPNPSAVAASSIVRLDAVDAAPATYTSITSVDYGAGPSTYGFQGPMTVHVDYVNGAMYVTDAATQSTPITLIRMTDFPPAGDGSEATVSELSGATDSVYWSQQVLVLDDGRVALLDVEESDLTYPYEFRVAVLPESLDIESAQFSTVFGGGSYTPMGLVQLPSGKLLISTGSRLSGGSDTGLFTLDDYTDTTLTDFVTDATVGYGSANNEFIIPFTMAVSHAGDYVYVSDTGAEPPYHNGRIVRYSTDGSSGTAFTSYGSEGAGTDEFTNPVILGVLPDNKLYIMDVGNSRLARVDPGVFDGEPSGWTESDETATLHFEYWYNHC
jgi:hypothetical protein